MTEFESRERLEWEVKMTGDPKAKKDLIRLDERENLRKKT